MRFTDQVAIITGAASGIGLAAARLLGAEGARIVVVDLDLQKSATAVESIRSAGSPDVWACACDVSREEQVVAAVEGALKQWGRVDIIVNNAGLMVFKPLEEHTAEDWTRILSVDLLGAFFFMKQAFLKMPNGGSVVNISSIHAVETTPLVASYAAAKAALVSLTRSGSIEGKAKGIRVNTILPGAIDTPMLWENPNLKSGLETIQTSDVGKPEDVAEAIAFLASSEARFITGAALRVDGGRLDRL